MADQPVKQVFYNRMVDKGQLKKLVAWAFTHYGSAKTAQMADMLKDLGFRYATKAGVSISVDDLQVPESKRELLEEAEREIRATEDRYQRGEITEVERFQKVIDTWNSTSEDLKDEVVKNFRAKDPLNSVYMMAFSGARGNISQVRQLVGMRGLMADPQGEIIDLPIKTNFREGLTVTEYIISSYGARKGLVDTALRTADSGYLTRRLVDVSQDVIVREMDCGTQRGIKLRSMTSGDRILIPLRDRLLGRVLAEDAVHPQTGEVVARRNEPLSEEKAVEIHNAGIEEVFLRSPLTCEAARSVCQHCYGWSLAHGHLVDLGEAVGIIAAQSIGEPGTQLTMRTFHTGGVFTGEVAQQFRAPFAGTVKFAKKMRTRPMRTRHGEDALQMENNSELVITPSESGQSPITQTVTQGSTILVRDGMTVQKGQLIAEVAIVTKAKVSTEKAAKDVASDLAGEVKFDGLLPEDKTDRQGNTTRIAARGGLLWILSGEVYNLPPMAEAVVKNGQLVAAQGTLAETKLTSEHGGVVRLKQEEANARGREIEIITASVQLNSARVRMETQAGRDQYVIYTADNQRFSLKTTPGTKVQSGQLVAELIDESYRTQTGGILKYADGLDVAKRGKAKLGYEVIQGGKLLWIPEESHEVNKDISLLAVEDGQYVEANTEVVKDIFCQNSGIVEVTQKNDILREIVIKPGDLHLVDDPEAVIGLDGKLVVPGQEVIPGLSLEEMRYVEFVETPEGPALLLRPVEEFTVPNEPNVPAQASVSGKGGTTIELRTVQRIPYKDGERVKSVEGVELLRTQLVLEISQGHGSEDGEGAGSLALTSTQNTPLLVADIELPPDPHDPDVMRLQLIVSESLVIRRDTAADATSGSTHTRLLVEDGDTIEPGAVVARTEIQCKEAGVVRGIREGSEAIRRMLLVREADRIIVDTPTPSKLKVGALVVAGAELVPGVVAPESGQVLEVDSTSVTLRLARPYRVSNGAVLHIDDGDLVQRGDNLVLLVFERTKTGDIIQGLPRIEELLEARKPKEACILARRPGTAQVIYGDEQDPVEIKVIESDGVVTDYPLGPGQNVIVQDGADVLAGEALTDGPANPHEILEVLFDYSREQMGDYNAALLALQQVQTFLVNEVQSVYQSQGIDISDKHIEVIVRQMTSKVRVDDGGDTTMLPGELVELRQIEQVNEAMAITGGAPAQYTPMLLGITKASLNTDSFISAASFQETTRVLTEAAIEGKSDWLRGLKENVIIGRLIPAGTGFNAYEDMTSNPEYELTSFGSGLEVEAESLDVVLDDRTARSYTGGFETPGYGMTPNSVLPDLTARSFFDDDELIDDGNGEIYGEDEEDDEDDED